MILNCVVIDDDPEALNQITSHIKRTPTLQLIGAYTSAREAVRDVRNGHVDVLYLAIQMPELSGIEFARLVPESCRLVFTTAYKEYAFDGIKAGAADYLLKPISFEDFQESYKRVRATFDEYQLQDPIERDRCLVAKVENKFVRIDLDDILYIESMNDYVRFHLTQGRKVTTFSNLKRLESASSSSASTVRSSPTSAAWTPSVTCASFMAKAASLSPIPTRMPSTSSSTRI
jgi:DNA-binding LytR/AlgR family response regulator